MDYEIPASQCAVQLIGPDELTLNTNKAVDKPGPHQILCRVEAVGLCFSDLKLLKQFSSHARKTEILSGIEPSILEEIPSYVPGNAATVPGHEAVVRIWAVGTEVTAFKPGERYLVQTDYRWLPTANSNASFGYNFEGALQEYVLVDERVITSPQGDSMFIPASEELSASAIALVEPWACVEDAYAVQERGHLKEAGEMLVVAEDEVDAEALASLLASYGKPGRITWVGNADAIGALDVAVKQVAEIAVLDEAAFDDVLYFGSCAGTLESLFSKVATRGLLNIVLGGGQLGRKIVTTVGRVHYGGIRIIGTSGNDPRESMRTIPPSGEIRAGDKINVIGAGGPMGVMHVIRNICQGVEGVSVFAGDVSEERLAELSRIAAPLAAKNGVDYQTYNPQKNAPPMVFDYVALMVPVPALVAQAVESAAPGAIVNIFAGIPAHVTGEIDLDAYIAKGLYFVGTSGSVLEDMKLVLAKVTSGRLDTNLSVAAVCGLEGAVEGIRAVENHLIPGKIIVYPSCRGMGLTELSQLAQTLPKVAEKLDEGLWTRAAENELLAQYE